MNDILKKICTELGYVEKRDKYIGNIYMKSVSTNIYSTISSQTRLREKQKNKDADDIHSAAGLLIHTLGKIAIAFHFLNFQLLIQIISVMLLPT